MNGGSFGNAEYDCEYEGNEGEQGEEGEKENEEEGEEKKEKRKENVPAKEEVDKKTVVVIISGENGFQLVANKIADNGRQPVAKCL